MRIVAQLLAKFVVCQSGARLSVSRTVGGVEPNPPCVIFGHIFQGLTGFGDLIDKLPGIPVTKPEPGRLDKVVLTVKGVGPVLQ